MHSLAAKLLLSFLVVVAVGVLAVAYLANRATDAEFESYVAAGGMLRNARVSEVLAGFYGATASWQQVGPVLDGLARGPQERLVLADSQGEVVADTAGHSIGQPASALGLGDPTAVVVDGRPVGQVYALAANGSAVGRGQVTGGPAGVGGQGRGRRAQSEPSMGNQPAAQSLEQGFLDSVTRNLWLAALVAGLLALALALLLTRQIVRPLHLLSLAAGRLAAGDLGHRVPVASGDELGTLAVSFNAMASTLERNEAARRNLLADVAHELRTPLSVIEGTADAMLDGVFDLTSENVRVIKDQAGLLTKLIADLRDLSLAEAGQLALAKEPTDLAELAKRAIQSYEAPAREKGVRLTLEANQPGLMVLVDPMRITQVLGNLIGNALRHTPSGGQIVVSVQQVASGSLRIVVMDSGEGIAVEDLSHVFDRFYRADKSRARRSGGSGLGLAIARQIVVAHEGRIWAESRPGAGASFMVELPLSVAADRKHAEERLP